MPFEDGRIEAKNALFMGARYHPGMPKATLWQPFKPFADELSRNGHSSSPDLPDQKFDTVLCLIPKQVDEAKYWIAQGLKRLQDGGTIAVCAANDANGNRLAGWLEECGVFGINSESANKARVVWGAKTKSEPAAWIEKGAPRLHDLGDVKLWTQPGLFSWDRIDAASKLLVENLQPLKGSIADFGCGYGYLSHAVNKEKVQSIMLVEADARALDCAKKNLEGVNIIPIWHDAEKMLPPATQLDAIIMNPPFHTGKKTDTDLGQEFIRTAFSSLKRGGTLYMVANKHLPYEAVLESLFSSTTKLAQGQGFKVLKAVK